MNSKRKKILITGGAGFIGSHLIRSFINKYPSYEIFNLDALTYAGNLYNLKDVDCHKNYKFLFGNISDQYYIDSIFNKYKFDFVINLAAESHVDRSIIDPLAFVNTNIIGTINLLNAFKKTLKDNFNNALFYQISSDEVYGSLGNNGFFSEETAYKPNSPYSASKASSDHFVRAYGKTYGIPYIISNCSNNYGPNQFPEKLIPLFINNIFAGESLPIFGKGENIRDWIHVNDHVNAIDTIFHHGENKETYNIGGNNEFKNLEVAKLLCKIIDKKLENKVGTSDSLIRFVKDRPGHDIRYAINTSKIYNKLGWTPSISFESGLEQTVDWYLNNKDWLENIKSGKYKNINPKL